MTENIELNPFEIKTELSKINNALTGISDYENYAANYRVLDAQNDKSIIIKLLFREISSQHINPELIKFLLLRYCPAKELTDRLWTVIKNNLSSNSAKIFALDLLRDLDTNWSYEQCEQYLENPDELVNADTKKLLNQAIINPEVQIDFLDFFNSLPDTDKIILLKSLSQDYTKDELANMLVPVFLSMPDTEAGKIALELLGNSKSPLAYHALLNTLEYADTKIVPAIQKNINLLKLSGIREDNTKEFYKNLLKDSKPYKFCITYPDGHGNQAIIISRINSSGKIQFVAIVIDDYKGIRDCFGFNEISKFECNAIIERFYRGQRALDIEPGILKTILLDAEKLSANKIPYEYACWKNLIADVKPDKTKIEYKNKKITKKEFEEILKYDFTDYWFLNSAYSDEFEEFIKILNKTSTEDYEKIIEDNLYKIFYPQEYSVWKKRILHTALLKSCDGEKKASQNLYSLYNDKELLHEFLKNVIRKSIYE